MLIKSQTTTLLQIYSELSLYFQVIFKSMRVADNTFYNDFECEWVNETLVSKLISVKFGLFEDFDTIFS